MWQNLGHDVLRKKFNNRQIRKKKYSTNLSMSKIEMELDFLVISVPSQGDNFDPRIVRICR